MMDSGCKQGGVRGGLLVVLAAAVLVAGCTAPAPKRASPPPPHSLEPKPPATGTMPAQARLAERLEDYHRALGARDAEKMFHMAPPYVQAHLKFEDFKKDLGIGADWAALPHAQIATKVNQTCSCTSGVVDAPGRPTVFRCLLLLDSTMKTADGKQSAYKNLEMWEYQKGEWYFGFPGGGADSCPEHAIDRD